MAQPAVPVAAPVGNKFKDEGDAVCRAEVNGKGKNKSKPELKEEVKVKGKGKTEGAGGGKGDGEAEVDDLMANAELLLGLGPVPGNGGPAVDKEIEEHDFGGGEQSLHGLLQCRSTC